MSDDLLPDDVAEVLEPTADEEPGEATPEAPRARLTLKRGGVLTDHAFEFASPAVIGRFDPAIGPVDVDLGQLDESAYISRKHAQITCEDGVWKVVDLGSSNGVYVLRGEFERVDEAVLEDGAVVAFGNAPFAFSIF